jgi:hypothetical protein
MSSKLKLEAKELFSELLTVKTIVFKSSCVRKLCSFLSRGILHETPFHWISGDHTSTAHGGRKALSKSQHYGMYNKT